MQRSWWSTAWTTNWGLGNWQNIIDSCSWLPQNGDKLLPESLVTKIVFFLHMVCRHTGLWIKGDSLASISKYSYRPHAGSTLVHNVHNNFDNF